MIIVIILFFVIYIITYLGLEKFVSRFINDNQVLESIWTIIPLIILFFLAFPSIRILYLMDEINHPLITCKVLGHQWYWTYEYSDFKSLEYDSYIILNFMRLLEVDNSLVLPVSIKIRLLVRSADVLHSWTVPSLGVKVDAVPGRLNQLNFTVNRLGLFFGQCSEICGINHRFIPIVVESISINIFEYWLLSKISEREI